MSVSSSASGLGNLGEDLNCLRETLHKATTHVNQFWRGKVASVRIRVPSMILNAETLRSTCGSMRVAPEVSTHGSRMAALQVGQETEEMCSGVRSRIFILAECDQLQP